MKNNSWSLVAMFIMSLCSLGAKAGQLDVIKEAYFEPLPQSIDLDSDKVELGDKLFHDPRLSGNNTISCASCHSLKTGGTDRLPVSIGIDGKLGQMNSPTVFNSGFNFKQFWDGRADTLEQQVEGPLHNSFEMGSSWDQVVEKLGADEQYVAAFAASYPDEGISPDSIADAIATFERSLITPDAPFDRYLRGDENALTTRQKEGFKLFVKYRCFACHMGVNVGGGYFRKIGVYGDFFETKDEILPRDLGRFNVTGDERDKHVFKVPSLRNVAATAPYFHDGSVPDLQQAVRVMTRYQLGRITPPEKIDLLVDFLKSLSGNYKGQRVK